MNIFTHILKAYNFFNKPKVDSACITVTSDQLTEIIQNEYRRMTGKNFVGDLKLPDSKFLLPTDNMMKQLYTNYFLPFLEAFDIHYETAYDCNHFGVTYCDIHSLLKYGMAVGFIFYSFDRNGQAVGHSVGIYINNNKQLRVVEPQSETFNYSDLTVTDDMWFCFIQGLS